MNYINIHTTVIHSPELKGADPVERATWFMLLGFCVEMENSGRISGCREWKCRRWQQTVGVTLKEVLEKSDLWERDGDDLIVKFYPIEQEEEIKQRRDRARHNGTKGGRPKITQPEPTSEPASASTGKPTSESVKERKGKERKGKEGKEKEVTPLTPKGELDADLFETEPSTKDNGRVLPDRWRNIPKQDRRNHRVLRNNRLMDRIGSWFNRKPTNLWTLAEGIALSGIRPDADDVETLEAYYLASIDKDADFRRRDLITLLNNWTGELDRARLWRAENP